MPTNKSTYMKDYYAKNRNRILALLKERLTQYIHCEDCFSWLKSIQSQLDPNVAVITSIPDISELGLKMSNYLT